jgi:mycofactocin system glycosyltransferase
MKSFGFTLGEHVFLREDENGFCLYSRIPLRILRLNYSLYRIIDFIRQGGNLADFVTEHPEIRLPDLLRILLTLASRGYLKLESIPELENFPAVSVIIPVKDQPADLAECLASLRELDYPAEKLEILVIDDCSEKEVAGFVLNSGVRIIRQDTNRGPAFCRNFGAAETRGDILAFLDADCLAGVDWLNELLPFFTVSSVGAVGGYIEGHYRRSFLDRYERAASSLNMGRHLIFEGKSESSFYVPTANLLVARPAFESCGGFNQDMRIGEDVDFCWRLRNSGYSLLYAPYGTVGHKHRNALGKMLKRRGQYGTSEAPLYHAHPDKKKTMSFSIYPFLAFLSLTVALLMLNPYPLVLLPVVFLVELWRKSVTLKKHRMPLPAGVIAWSILRTYLSYFYVISFHLVRYYLILLFIPGFFLYSFWLFDAAILLLASLVDYSTKKPALDYPVFLFFYLMEHLVYQVGVFWGCWQNRYFSSYVVQFKSARSYSKVNDARH